MKVLVLQFRFSAMMDVFIMVRTNTFLLSFVQVNIHLYILELCVPLQAILLEDVNLIVKISNKC